MTQATNNHPRVTVCIPTYYGGESLVHAAKSLRESTSVDSFRLIVAVDGNPLRPEIAQQLNQLHVEIVQSSERGGQVARIKQMVAMVNSEIVVLTQDDILFDPSALNHIVTAFANDPNLTMVGVRVAPVKATSWFERVVEVGVELTRSIGMRWGAADNYLLASGRCLAFRADSIKKMSLPDEVINSDAYLYFANQQNHGSFQYLDEAIVYNRSPLHLKEHIRQAKKFEYSAQELSHYFGQTIRQEYDIPFLIAVQSSLSQLAVNPWYALQYAVLHMYTQFQKNEFVGSQTGTWETDTSTKRVK